MASSSTLIILGQSDILGQKISCESLGRKKFISPMPRGGRRISLSGFPSRRPFGYYLPIASYGTMFAAMWSSNGGLEAVVSK